MSPRSKSARKLPAWPAVLTVLSIRNPTPAELDRLLAPVEAPEMEGGE
ncbi:MAG: hypothetical protein NDI75_00970 [Candidatus Didemnitutus sp.]|nr:hypothetical protein [Candidatus Didemnitutus sp.]